jgi:type I restriction enzyme M protein
VITGALKSQVDKLWLEFWQGGISNPLSVIEQITFLMFLRLFDIAETREEKKASRLGGKFKGHFTADQQHLRWQNLMKLGGDSLLKTVRDEVFPHMREIAGSSSTFGRYMADAQLLVQKPTLLVKAIELIEKLPIDRGDLKGDIYEYMLSKLNIAGQNGQFRTPPHIRRLMVDLVDPRPDWVIGDPACGTAGFLVAVMEHLQEKFTSPQGILTEERDGETFRVLTGDLLEPYRAHIRSDMFHGYDFDVTMLRIAAMNLMLHGVDNPHIDYMDTLSERFVKERPKESKEAFDLILANPPFKGSLDEEGVDVSLRRHIKTRKTELLFPMLMLRMLKLGGRCAVIVPDGVLFGSSTAHVALRKILVEDNQLEGVVKLPTGVFRPYAGVATAILLFTKGGHTNDVFFYDVQADGFSLDDKRLPVPENDLPDVRERWKARNPKKDKDRTDKAFLVSKKEIVANKYDLSLNRYREIVHDEVAYEKPEVIIARLKDLEADIAKDLRDLEGMLK